MLKMKPIWKAALRITVLLVIIHFALSLPFPYIYRAPGGCQDVSEMVKVANAPKRNFHGRFFMTSVFSEPANGYLILLGALEKGAALIPKDSLSDELTDRQQVEYMTQDMELSKLMASIAAFRALGYPVKVERTPLLVRAVASWSRGRGLIFPGDQIVAVEGEYPRNVDELKAAIRKNRHMKRINLTIKRNGKFMKLSVPLVERNHRQVIGIIAYNSIAETNLPGLVDINSKNVIGSSAGLMFSLEIMRQVSGIDLSGGAMVAGTGAIDENGVVYPVDGVEMKVLSAERQGARYFFAPEENAGEARGAAVKLKVIAVKNLQDALKALKKINSSATVEDYRPDLTLPDRMTPVKLR